MCVCVCVCVFFIDVVYVPLYILFIHLQAAAKMLADKAIAAGSMDNVTVVVVAFQWPSQLGM